MTIANAQKFIRKGLSDGSLRDRLNSADNQTEIQQILEDENIAFTPEEFEVGFHNTLKECQTQEAANELQGFKLWWEFLANAIIG